MTRHRVGGRVWWIVAAVAAVVGVGWCLLTFELYEPLDANFDPLVQSTIKAGHSPIFDTATMNPCCFEAGQNRQVVADRLASSGFKQRDVGKLDEKFFSPEYLARQVHIFSRTATRFPCTDEFFIAVAFDEADKLVASEGTWTHAVCL